MLRQIQLNPDTFEELKKRETDLLKWFSRATPKERELVMLCHMILFKADAEKVKITNLKKYFEVKKNNGAILSYLLLLYSIYICKNDGFKKLYNKDEGNQILADIKDERTLQYFQKKKHTLFKTKLNQHYDKIKNWREKDNASWSKICILLRKNYSRYYRGINLDPSYICRMYKELKKEKEIPQITMPEIELPDIKITIAPDIPDVEFATDIPDIDIPDVDIFNEGGK